MEPSAPISRPCNDGITGDAAGATKLGLNTATSPSGRGSAASSPATSPPYWVHSHQRSFSNISVESVAPGAITLEDNDNAVDARNKGCWAKSVHIEDYVVINGNRTGIGAFVVWNITVETLRVSRETPWRAAIFYLYVARIVLNTISCRARHLGFGSASPSSINFAIGYSKPSPIPRLRCHRCHQRALYPSSGRSFWRAGEWVCNTFSSRYRYSPLAHC
jgi:hypothetical protein